MNEFNNSALAAAQNGLPSEITLYGLAAFQGDRFLRMVMPWTSDMVEVAAQWIQQLKLFREGSEGPIRYEMYTARCNVVQGTFEQVQMSKQARFNLTHEAGQRCLDSRHAIGPESQDKLLGGGVLHRFQNRSGVDYSAIYQEGEEIFSAKRQDEARMIQNWNELERFKAEHPENGASTVG